MRSLSSLLIVILFLVPSVVLGMPAGSQTDTPFAQDMHMDIGPPVETSELIIERLEMDFDDPWVLGGLGYSGATRVLLDDTLMLNTPGLPRVPVKTHALEVPAGATVTAVKAYHEVPSSTYLQSPVEAAPPQYLEGPNGPIEDSPVELYYDGDMFPADWFTYDLGRGLNDEGEPTIFVNMFVYPVRVEGLEKDQRMWNIKGLDIEVRYVPPMETESRSPRTEQYDMVLIGPEQFRDALQVLADHKDMTGLSCKVVSLSDIFQGSIFPTQGRDNAEKVKYFIKDALDNWGIKYVLLGGDSDKLPIRHVNVVDGFDDDAAMHLDGQWVLTDIYFGDIYDGQNQFSSWDENGNGTFGEWLGGRNGTAVDDPDFYMDVYVGRLPASTESELSDMVDKVIQYENNSEWNWFSRSAIAALDLFHAPDDPLGINEGEVSGDLLATDLQSKGYTVQKLYESLGTMSTAQINGAINGGLGLISMIGHGTYTAWGGGEADNVQIYYQNANIANLFNGVKLPVAHQASCLTGAFDNDSPSKYPGTENKDSMAEEFILKKDGGHIANYGYSRVAYGGKGFDHPNTTSGYMNGVLFNILASGPITPGKALSEARNDCMAQLGTSFVGDYKHMSMLNLVGDPSVALGGIGLSVTPDAQQMDIVPGETVHVELTIKNVGAYSTTAALTLDSPGSLWTASIDKNSMALDPGQQQKTTLTITAAQGSIADEIGVFKVMAGSSSNGRQVASIIEAKVVREQNLSISVENHEISMMPGTQSSFFLTVSNGGNGQENVSISVTDVPTSWSVIPDGTPMALGPFSDKTTNINVTVPAQTEAREYKMNISAVIDGSQLKETILVTVAVLEEKGILVKTIDDGGEVVPGESTTIQIEVANTGNIVENVTVGAITAPDGWTVTNDTAALVLGPFTTGQLDINVTSAEDALMGHHQIMVQFLSSSLTIDHQVNITVKMDREIQLVPPSDTEVQDGETATIALQVLNVGNVPEQVDLEMIDEPKGWTVDLETTTIDVLAFSSEVVSIDAIVPLANPPGQNTIMVLATGAGGLEWAVGINVTVLERTEGSAALVDEELKGQPGATVSTSVTYSNTGNVDVSIMLVPGETTTIDVVTKGEKVMVPVGQTTDVPFKLQIPADARAGDICCFDVTIEVEEGIDIQLNGSLTVERVLDLVIKTRPGTSYIRQLSIINNGNAEETITITITGIAAKWAKLSVTQATIGPGEQKEVSVTFRPPEGASSGTYKLEFVATPEDGAPTKEIMTFKVDRGPGDQVSAIGAGAMAAWVFGIIFAAILIFWLAMRRSGKAPEEPLPKGNEDIDDEEIGVLQMDENDPGSEDGPEDDGSKHTDDQKEEE